MDRMQKAEAYRKELGKTGAPALAGTDPELAAIRERLEYGEIAGQGCLDARRRRLITLVVLAAIQTPEGIGEETRAALHQGVRPEEIREALYQCAPYIGFPRTEAALRHADAALEAAGIALPLPEGGTVSEEDRFEKGLAVRPVFSGMPSARCTLRPLKDSGRSSSGIFPRSASATSIRARGLICRCGSC